MNINQKKYILIIGLISTLLYGCSSGAIPTAKSSITKASDTPAAPTSAPEPTAIPPTPTTLPATPTMPPPTATTAPTALPTETATPLPTATNTPAAPTPSGDQAVYIYLIQTGTGGPVACGSSLIKVNTGLPRTGDNATDISAALHRLLVKSKYLAGLYNPVYLSNFEIANVDFNPSSGQATVDLTGTYVRSGDHCDDGRVHDQIWTTIRQFPGVKSVLVRLNGNLLGDILSTSPSREGSPEKKKQP